MEECNDEFPHDMYVGVYRNIIITTPCWRWDKGDVWSMNTLISPMRCQCGQCECRYDKECLQYDCPCCANSAHKGDSRL